MDNYIGLGIVVVVLAWYVWIVIHEVRVDNAIQREKQRRRYGKG